MNIYDLANYISIIGTCCGLFSRVPQVYRTYTTKSAGDLSTNTMVINITANSCFLFYTIVNEQYPIMFNCLSVITLEGSLIYMKNKFSNIKKSNSEIDLIESNLSGMSSSEGPPIGFVR
uniref:PQ-loop repeat-containing protein n=1 Tax=viral metagenome TaxID=1070528 RepID=A0A6C0F9K7_9ZZZZ|tara:strand:- start:887 stop:1243 length:357 start_codon:yes stop_codon:yes gene_type:complete